VKRISDFVAAVIGLVLLTPLLVVVALLVRAFLGAPVLFRQSRPGLNGKFFELIKFRSMTDLRDANGERKTDSQRMTGLGRFLRATSLDELPGLWNVVKGDMSLVGPRPLLVEYLSRYSTTQARRHEVRPGVTGLTATRGRNNLSWERKFELDVWYVDNHSARLDAAILLWTVAAVFSGRGVSPQSSATMPPFAGSD
jgi:sugar transferase EpsL